jgi:hypothetical protein
VVRLALRRANELCHNNRGEIFSLSRYLMRNSPFIILDKRQTLCYKLSVKNFLDTTEAQRFWLPTRTKQVYTLLYSLRIQMTSLDAEAHRSYPLVISSIEFETFLSHFALIEFTLIWFLLLVASP